MSKILIWNVRIPELSGDDERRVYLYLPDSYTMDDTKKYPVMYMFDGHNVFYDSHATYGKSWGMQQYMDQAQKEWIIAAVECNQKGNCRLEEYSPVDFVFSSVGKITGKGKVYMDWLTSTLKPYIDSHYRTLPDRENTIICGSSMGGLMALYGVCAYNQVFQRGACLSPSVWIAPEDILKIIETCDLLPDTCIYLDYGSEELNHHENTANSLFRVSEYLLTRNVGMTLRIIPGGTHCEASWQKQIPVFMECLNR